MDGFLISLRAGAKSFKMFLISFNYSPFFVLFPLFCIFKNCFTRILKYIVFFKLSFLLTLFWKSVIRPFYVIRPKADTTVFKIGISSGFNRLESYLNYYGFTEENKCTGVLLYYLVGTKKQKNLSEFHVYNSKARQKEKQLTSDLSPDVIRGKEYFRISKTRLYKAIRNA